MPEQLSDVGAGGVQELKYHVAASVPTAVRAPTRWCGRS